MKSIKTNRYQIQTVNIKPWLFLRFPIPFYVHRLQWIPWSNPKNWNRSDSCDLNY